MFTREVDRVIAHNQRAINNNIKEQTKKEEESLTDILNQIKELSERVDGIQNIIIEKEIEKTITIPYKEYLSLQQKENDLCRMKKDMKELVEEYNSKFRYHDIQVKKYGKDDWEEILVPFRKLDMYENLLQEEEK